MIAWNPDQLGKAFRQDLKRMGNLLLSIPYIARNNEPVVWTIEQRAERMTIERMADMQVTDGEEVHNHQK
jgi:hypothetical protein